jgi:hypothetical protein
MLRQGDMILANVATAGAPEAGVFAVAGVAGGRVDVASLTPFGASNPD